jgi:hypothetical protein
MSAHLEADPAIGEPGTRAAKLNEHLQEMTTMWEGIRVKQITKLT